MTQRRPRPRPKLTRAFFGCVFCKGGQVMNKTKRENRYEAKRALEQIHRILATEPLTPNEREELQLQKVIEGLEREIKQSGCDVAGKPKSLARNHKTIFRLFSSLSAAILCGRLPALWQRIVDSPGGVAQGPAAVAWGGEHHHG